MPEKHLKKLAPPMKRWLSEHYGKQDAAARWQKAQALDERWLREEGTLGGKKNLMADSLLWAYAFFAFYEATDRTFPKEDMPAFIDAAIGKKLRLLSHFDMNKWEKKPWFVALVYRVFARYAEKAEKHRGKDWGDTWHVRLNPEKHNKGVAFVFDNCPINDFARKYGYLDFLPNLCAIDQTVCRSMHACLIRHKTLACGDGECNYWIVGDKDPEAVADTGSK